MKEKLSYSILKSEEMLQFVSYLITLIRKQIEVDAFIDRQIVSMESTQAEIAILTQRDSKNEFTIHLNDADEKRGNYGSFILDSARSLANLDTLFKMKSVAAQKVLAVFDKHGFDPQAGYAVESVQINAILAELASMSDVVQAAGFNDVVAALSEAQATFEEIFEQKLNSDANKAIGRIRPHIMELSRRVKYILTYVDANSIDLPEQFSELSSNIDELIVSTMVPARARQTRNAN